MEAQAKLAALDPTVRTVHHGAVTVTPPEGLLVVSYGGGVNSVAVLVLLARLGLRPVAIVMADPGSEHQATVRYRDQTLPPWLAAQGFPKITVITRAEEGEHVKRAWRLETLYDECFRIHALPSVAYGWTKCSAKYKGDTQRWWINRQQWAATEWAFARRLVKVIGYDKGEERRVKKAFQNPWEDQRFVPWYPLFDAGMDRDGCLSLIASAGLPPPPKSSCTFCPNNTIEEWRHLRVTEPGRFQEAILLSKNAEAHIESPDVVGLMRCNPHGKRQLHVWAEGGYPEIPLGGAGQGDDDSDAMPCECAL